MIVGTAGHIDHGKTALVRALTGVDADRLKEEKARGITIDLGFAYLGLEEGEVLGFVDVPGHHRFIRNMLAGATGIDFVLLVVAADDGVMPQTREHFDIVSLLGFTRGAVALTKCDLVSEARRDEVAAEIAVLLKGSPLEDAPVFPVAAPSGDGIAALRDELVRQAGAFAPRHGDGLFRLAVDRCFGLQGVGTVVTGAVISGQVQIGDQVMLSPGGLPARVRGIHAQNREAQQGHVGQRCALNLAGQGISTRTIARGDVVLDTEAHAPTAAIDCDLTLLASEPKSLGHWTPVRLYHGAAEVGARAALLQADDIRPGSTGRVQLVLDRPVAASIGDRFVIRDTSGARTMGGGRIIDLRGPRRRRRTPKRLAQLAALSQADPTACLSGLLTAEPFAVDITEFARDRAMTAAQRDRLLAQVSHVRARHGAADLVFSEPVWNNLATSARAAMSAFHQRYPQLLGAGAAQLAKSLRPHQTAKTTAVILRQLIADGVLATQGGTICLPGHRMALNVSDNRLWKRIEPLLAGDNRFRPPLGRECADLLGANPKDVTRILKTMCRQHGVVETARDRFFLEDTLREIARIVAEIAAEAEDGWFPAAALRTRLNNGRKVAIEILEYFDRQGLTIRREDLRRAVPQAIAVYTSAPGAAKTPQVPKEENRPRWGVRTSNPGGAVSQS